MRKLYHTSRKKLHLGYSKKYMPNRAYPAWSAVTMKGLALVNLTMTDRHCKGEFLWNLLPPAFSCSDGHRQNQNWSRAPLQSPVVRWCRRQITRMRMPSLYCLRVLFLGRRDAVESLELRSTHSPECDECVNVGTTRKNGITTMILRSFTVVDLVTENDPCSS